MDDSGRCNATLWSGISGSLWDPGVTADASVDERRELLTVVVRFKTARYSDRYRVSVQGHGLSFSRDMSKVSEFLSDFEIKCLLLFFVVVDFSHISSSKQNNETSLNVTFELGLWQLSQCELLLKVSPALTFGVTGAEMNLSPALSALFCFCPKRFSHFSHDARMNAGAQLQPSIIVDVSKYSGMSLRVGQVKF